MPKSNADRALLVLMALAVVGFFFVIKDLFVQRITDTGDIAPQFSIRTDDGRQIKRSEFGGKLLVLNFWATWCPPCVEETPSLSQFAASMRNEGVVVLGVSVDKSEQAYRRFLEQAKPAFATARDPEADIPTEYGSFKWPETYVIDQSGKVRAKFIGAVNWTDPQVVQQIRGMM